MAYPQLRSMNASLKTGAVEGSYKMIRPNVECSTIDAMDGNKNLTYDTREPLNLQYYGIGMARNMRVPGQTGSVTSNDFYMNRLDRVGSTEDGSSSW